MRKLATSWTNTLNKLGFRRRQRLASRRGMYYRRAKLESLEPRHLLSITVNTLVDENDGINVGGVSLRDAVAYAATQPGTDAVEFDPSLVDGVIELLYGQITLNSDVEIVGLGQDQLTIDAHGASRVFVVSSGKAATISGLTITGGVGAGAGIYAHGNLTLDSVHVTANSASTNSGGGIYVNDTGSLRLLRSTIDNNTAVGRSQSHHLPIRFSRQSSHNDRSAGPYVGVRL